MSQRLDSAILKALREAGLAQSIISSTRSIAGLKIRTDGGRDLLVKLHTGSDAREKAEAEYVGCVRAVIELHLQLSPTCRHL